MRPWLDIQLVAFPQDGFLRYPKARENLIRALDMLPGAASAKAARENGVSTRAMTRAFGGAT